MLVCVLISLYLLSFRASLRPTEDDEGEAGAGLNGRAGIELVTSLPIVDDEGGDFFCRESTVSIFMTSVPLRLQEWPDGRCSACLPSIVTSCGQGSVRGERW
jgi:hypothetical protein